MSNTTYQLHISPSYQAPGVKRDAHKGRIISPSTKGLTSSATLTRVLIPSYQAADVQRDTLMGQAPSSQADKEEKSE